MTEEDLERIATLVGHMDLRFNPGFQDENTPCPQITWTGVITFGDDVYAITYEPTAPPEPHGDTFRVEEIWRIDDPDDIEVVDDVATACRGVGLMWGTDKAEADPRGGHANGEVLFVDPDGPFDEELVGRSIHWGGDFGESQTEFSGPFRIN